MVLGIEFGDWTDASGETDPFIQYTQIRSQSHYGIVPSGEVC